MIKSVLVLLACSMLSLTALCQNDEPPSTEDPTDFEEVLKTDFTKLIKGFQQGFELAYTKDKTSIEGKLVKQLYGRLYAQANASVGTTTNLTGLFDQQVLPASSGEVIVHFLLPSPATKYFYAPQITNNLLQLANPSISLGSIPTASPGYVTPFEYREPLREKVIAGKVGGANGRLYTGKRISWLSLRTKYDYAKYAFFKSSNAFASQLSNPYHRSWSVRFDVNTLFSWNKTDVGWLARKYTLGLPWRPDFIYMNFYVARGLDNNITGLKKQSVQTITSQYIDPASGTVRQVIDSKTAYEGEFRQYTTTTTSLEVILAPFQQVALFGNVKSIVIDKTEKELYQLANTHAWEGGLYFYGDGNNSKLNIGVFYKREQNSLTDDWVGTFNLRTSIPIAPL